MRAPLGHSGVKLKRRQVLGGLCAFSVGYSKLATSQEPGSSEPPTEGDHIVFAYGEHAGKPIAPDDLAMGVEQIFAFPQDPASKVVRNGTRLNQLIVVRLSVEGMSEATLNRSADGVVAYSGVCSHTGCDVTDWNEEFVRFQCPCHESQFDPNDAARVVGGPAPWPLAAVPLKISDGLVTVAGGFEGRVGFMQPGQDPFSSFGQ